MASVTGIVLAALRALADAATPGPWSVYQTMHAEPKVVDSTGNWPSGEVAPVSLSPENYGRANAAFIAAARGAVPALLDEVERLGIAIEREHSWAVDYRERLDALEARYEEAVSAHWATQTYLDEAREAVARVRAIHHEYPIYDECPHDDQEACGAWESSDGGIFLCGPVLYVQCAECRCQDCDGKIADWPCATLLALDGTP